MGPIEAFTTAWRKSFTYGGKATRSEYRWFYLTNLIAIIVIFLFVNFIYVCWHKPSVTEGNNTLSSIYYLYVLASAFPSFSINFRRLRDIGKSWGWIFINLIPFIGGFWWIALMCQRSGRYENEGTHIVWWLDGLPFNAWKLSTHYLYLFVTTNTHTLRKQEPLSNSQVLL